MGAREDMDLIKKQLLQARSGFEINLQPVVRKPVTDKKVDQKAVLLEPDEIEKNKTAMKAGYMALYEEIQKLSKEDVLALDDLDEPLPISAFQIKDETIGLLANPPTDKDGIDLVGCTEQSLLGFYLIAKKLYEDKLLDEVVNAFILLTHIAPEVSPFWLGLGLAYESQQNWTEATAALYKAIEVNPRDFAPFKVLMRIASEIHDFEPVKQILETHKETPEIKEEVETALQYLPEIMKGGL